MRVDDEVARASVIQTSVIVLTGHDHVGEKHDSEVGDESCPADQYEREIVGQRSAAEQQVGY